MIFHRFILLIWPCLGFRPNGSMEIGELGDYIYAYSPLESNFNASEPAVKERSRFQASVRNQEERKRKCNMNVHVVLEYLLSKKALSSGEKLGERTEQFIINRSRWIMGPQADFSASEILLKVAKHVHYIQKTIPTRKSKRGRVPLMKE